MSNQDGEHQVSPPQPETPSLPSQPSISPNLEYAPSDAGSSVPLGPDSRPINSPRVPPPSGPPYGQVPPPYQPPLTPAQPSMPTLPSGPTYGHVSQPYQPPIQPSIPGPTAPTYPPLRYAPPSSPVAPPYGYRPPNPSFPLPAGWQPKQTFLQSTSGKIVVISAAALLLLMLVGGLGVVILQRLQPHPDGYLGTSSTAVDFIQWTEDSNHYLSGTVESVSATADNTTKSDSAAFTGVHNGSSISLTFSVLGISSTITGTLDGDTLTLSVPDQNGLIATDVFHAASVQEYNDAANALRQRIQSQAAAAQSAQATVDTQQTITQATQTAQTQLDQAVTSANNQLASDLSSLPSDVQSLASSSSFSDALNAYASDWSQMQKDYQQEQADYANGCGVSGNANIVRGDANVVQGDRNTITSDGNALNGYVNAFNSDLSHVKTDIKAVQADWTTLKSAVAADAGGSVSAQFTQNDIDTAVGNAQKQVDASNSALSQAQSQGSQYDQEAAQLNTDAQNLANSMHC